jgi:hypothetical protein
VWVTQWVWVQTNFYCFETPKPKPKPHPQYGEPPFEVLVPDTSRDGRAGGAPLALRSTAYGGHLELERQSPKCASRPCNDAHGIAKSFWSDFYGGLSWFCV